MALWGDNDNVSVAAGGTVYVDSYTKSEAFGGYPVVGAGTSFGLDGYAQIGDVIRFGEFAGTYYGDAVITNITGTGALFIGSTAGLSGSLTAGITGVVTTFQISQLPKSSILDHTYSEANGTVADGIDRKVVGVATAGVEAAAGSVYETGAGWVGVTTYNDNEGNLRVKSEILVAMSGISTGNDPVYGNPPVNF